MQAPVFCQPTAGFFMCNEEPECEHSMHVGYGATDDEQEGTTQQPVQAETTRDVRASSGTFHRNLLLYVPAPGTVARGVADLAIGVSHTACKDEFRQNIRSHSSWSVFNFYRLIKYHPYITHSLQR